MQTWGPSLFSSVNTHLSYFIAVISRNEAIHVETLHCVFIALSSVQDTWNVLLLYLNYHIVCTTNSISWVYRTWALCV